MTGGPKPGPRPNPSPPRSGPVVEARRVDSDAGQRPPASEFSYTVVTGAPPAPSKRPVRPEPPPTKPGAEKRRASRQRTRLRTGKIIDMAGRFVSECLVFDRSETGSRLRLPSGVTLAARTFQFFDDQQDALSLAEIVWRREQEIGIRLRPAPSTPQSRALAAEMRRRFYAVPK